MGLIVPFYVAVIGAIVIVGLIAEAIVARKIEWRTVGLAALAGLIAAPPLIYTFVIVGTDPIWKVWANQLVILSPHPLHYVLGYALVGVLAIIGIVKTWKRRVIDPKLIGWLIAVPLLIYLPFNSQRRLIEELADSVGDLARRRIGVCGAARVESIAAGEAADAASALYRARSAELVAGRACCCYRRRRMR